MTHALYDPKSALAARRRVGDSPVWSSPGRIGSTGFARSLSLRSLSTRRRARWAAILTSIPSILVLVGSATAATFNVDVAPGGLFFSPSSVTIQAGDTVMWTWKGSGHSVTAGLPGHNTGLFDSGVHNSGFTFSFTFPDAGTFDYHCTPHGACCGMIGTVTVAAPSPTPTPTPTPTSTPTPTPRPPSQAQLLNISTRMNVQTGDNVLIGGFIVTGSEPKRVILRAIGPSLPLAGVLANPTLELHDGSGTIASNDNWKDMQQAEIEATGHSADQRPRVRHRGHAAGKQLRLYREGVRGE